MELMRDKINAVCKNIAFRNHEINVDWGNIQNNFSKTFFFYFVMQNGFKFYY